jgi:hypothetical protein
MRRNKRVVTRTAGFDCGERGCNGNNNKNNCKNNNKKTNKKNNKKNNNKNNNYNYNCLSGRTARGNGGMGGRPVPSR